jgi:hypothetical protein
MKRSGRLPLAGGASGFTVADNPIFKIVRQVGNFADSVGMLDVPTASAPFSSEQRR